MQNLKLAHGKLTLARVTPVIRAVFAPFGVQDDGTLLADRNLFPMWLDLLVPLRTLLDEMGIDRPADDHATLLINLLAEHVGGLPYRADDERLDGETYDLREAFDLAVALDDGHGLLDATRIGVVHDDASPDVWTNTVSRRVDAHQVGSVLQSEAEALHDALRRHDHRQAARCIEAALQRSLLAIRDSKARQKVAALVQINNT
jgi:hypothetical protein